MEIDITEFFHERDPFEFSRSRAEGGPNAGYDTWRAALRAADDSPLLTTPEQLNALRNHVRGFGAWGSEEIDNWTAAECNALFIQMVSGDLRDAGLDQAGDDFESPEWREYQRRAEAGECSGLIFHVDGNVFYELSN